MKRDVTEVLRNKGEVGDKNDERCEKAAFALPRPSKTLTALTTSALALPGIAGSARADAPIERASASSSFSYYKEDNLSPSRFFDDGTGSRERYEIFQTQLRFDLPMTDRTDLGLDILFEDMSGASPWYVQAETGTGKALQVMSGATIDDQRLDILADVDFFMDNGKDTVSAGVSTEKDYTSFNIGIGAERNLNEKNTTVSTSMAFSYDWLDPTDADDFDTRPNDEEKWSVDLFFGVSQILSRASTMQVTFNYKHSDGYLSDPYKAIKGIGPLDTLLSDSRPGNKDQLSILLRYRHHFESLASSVHLDGRFYTDDYGINSLTAELAWYQNFFEWLTITPSIRWYSQSKADFYETVLPAGVQPRHRSSDFRLSPYGAVSAKIKAEIEILDAFDYDAPPWLQRVGVSEGMDLIATVAYERYYSDGDISLLDVKESDEAPGLVRFHVFSVSLNGRF
jgi:hypothetical protein